jgi:hypothetical protein
MTHASMDLHGIGEQLNPDELGKRLLASDEHDDDTFDTGRDGDDDDDDDDDDDNSNDDDGRRQDTAGAPREHMD